ncbi:Uncharacterised protein [Mycobacteroides abscessus]|nr:Uncharacterised protein [Mycobacteroides abscessus]
MDLCASVFGQIEIVGLGGVLGVVFAAGHTGRASDTTRALGSGAAEERVGHRLAGLVAEEDAHVGGVIGVLDAQIFGHRQQHLIGRGGVRSLCDAQHAAGLVVIRGQLGLPVADMRPLLVDVKLLQRLVEGVAVDQRATTHTHRAGDEGLAENRETLGAVTAQRRCPHRLAHVPVIRWEIFAFPTFSHVQYADSVALFGEAEGRNAPTETGPDDDYVVVIVHGGQPTGWSCAAG